MIAPALTTWLQWLVSDVDGANARAEERLREILADASEIGHAVVGVVGDEDQLLAIADALSHFHADAIVLVMNMASERNHEERQLIKHVERRFGLPVTACAVSGHGRVAII